MSLARSKALWVGMAAAASLVALVFYPRKRNHRAWPDRQDRSRRDRPGQDRSPYVSWRLDRRFALLPAGKVLRFELASAAIVHWTVNQWDTVQDTRTTAVETGLHMAELPTEALDAGARIQFTFFWPEINRWEGEDFEVKVDYARQHAS